MEREASGQEDVSEQADEGRVVIVDAIVLVVAVTLLLGGLWVLWNATTEAWREWHDA